MKKLLATLLCVVVLAVCAAAVLTACGDDSKEQGGGGESKPVSYSVSCEEDDVFGDYYDLRADYTKVGAGETVTVTVDYGDWNFLEAAKVYANGTECAAGAAEGTYTFVMPAADVTVTAEMRVLSVPTAESGMGWTRTHDLVADGLNNSFEVTFGTKGVQNTIVTNSDGYSTMMYVEVISTNREVMPNEAVTRIQKTSGNSLDAYVATVSFDSKLLSPGQTTIILIDKDNDRAITLDVTVVAKNY